MTPNPHDIVRVHPNVSGEGRNLGGVLLTVVLAGPLWVDGTETAGSRPIHLPLSDVDLVFKAGAL